MTMRIYLSGPMAGCTDEEMMGWRNYIKKWWPQYRYHDPSRRDYRATEYQEGFEKHIIELDKFDIACSNVLLVYLSRYSAGTLMELMWAFLQGKLVITINAMGVPVSPWVRYNSTKVLKTI